VVHFADPVTGEDSGTEISLERTFVDVDKPEKILDYEVGYLPSRVPVHPLAGPEGRPSAARGAFWSGLVVRAQAGLR
jgi:hypothetical protein